MFPYDRALSHFICYKLFLFFFCFSFLEETADATDRTDKNNNKLVKYIYLDGKFIIFFFSKTTKCQPRGLGQVVTTMIRLVCFINPLIFRCFLTGESSLSKNTVMVYSNYALMFMILSNRF